jgi:hypothetical protein
LAPSSAKPPSIVSLRVHTIGNIPRKPISEAAVNQIFELLQQKILKHRIFRDGRTIDWIFSAFIAKRTGGRHHQPTADVPSPASPLQCCAAPAAAQAPGELQLRLPAICGELLDIARLT